MLQDVHNTRYLCLVCTGFGLTGWCKNADHIHVYEASQEQWSRHSVANSSELVLCRHTATVLPDHCSIFCLGGGLNCFGFGTTFSPAVILDITSLVDQHTLSDSANAAAHQASNGTAHGQNPDRTLDYGSVAAYQASDSTMCEHNPHRSSAIEAAAAHQASDDTTHGQNPDRTLISGSLAEEKSFEPIAIHHAAMGTKAAPGPAGVTRGDHLQGGAGRGGAEAPASLTSGSHCQGGLLSQVAACKGHGYGEAQEASKQGLAVARLQAKAAKDALRGLGWLDRSCRADTDSSTGVICLPVTDSGCTMLQSAEFSSAQPESDPVRSAEPGSSQHSSAHLDSKSSSAHLSSAQLSSDGLSSAQHGSAAQLNYADASSVPRSSSYADTCMASEVPLTDGSPGKLKGSTVGAKGGKRKAVRSQKADMACLQALMQAGLAVVRPIAMNKSGRVDGGPAHRLRGAVAALLQQQVSMALMCYVSPCFAPSPWYCNGSTVCYANHMFITKVQQCSNMTRTMVSLCGEI